MKLRFYLTFSPNFHNYFLTFYPAKEPFSISIWLPFLSKWKNGHPNGIPNGPNGTKNVKNRLHVAENTELKIRKREQDGYILFSHYNLSDRRKYDPIR